jgi:hypothetical protein
MEHDARVRAEQRARDLYVLDSVKTAQWSVRLEGDARRVDTLVVQTRTTIAPTKEILSTAIEHITDTVLVRQAAESAGTALDRCTELANSCATFRVTARATMDSLTRLISDRDRDRINTFAKPSAPRVSHGVSIGVGYCVAADGRRTPCLALTYGFHLRIF